MQALFLENQVVALQLGDHPVAGGELSPENLLRERILDLRLDGTLQRPCSVHGVEARLADPVARRLGEPQLNVALRKALPQTAELNVHDGANLLPAERMEDHDLVDAI